MIDVTKMGTLSASVYEISETFNDWMQRYGQKTPKKPQNGGFPPFVTPNIFFKNRALSLLYPYGARTSCEKSEKNNEQ